jgi:hypothetical protein
MAKASDDKTLALIREVNRQKAEISKAERPNWITNCSFSYTENPSQAINIHVESNIRNLVCIAAFLQDRERSYADVAKTMGVEAPNFTWGGFAVKDWLEDIKMRINKIQLASKKKKLEVLEARLNAIISPELRAEIELQAIADELG